MERTEVQLDVGAGSVCALLHAISICVAGRTLLVQTNSVPATLTFADCEPRPRAAERNTSSHAGNESLPSHSVAKWCPGGHTRSAEVCNSMKIKLLCRLQTGEGREGKVSKLSLFLKTDSATGDGARVTDLRVVTAAAVAAAADALSTTRNAQGTTRQMQRR